MWGYRRQYLFACNPLDPNRFEAGVEAGNQMDRTFCRAQCAGEELHQLAIRTIFQGRTGETDAQRTVPHSGHLVARSARLEMDLNADHALAFGQSKRFRRRHVSLTIRCQGRPSGCCEEPAAPCPGDRRKVYTPRAGAAPRLTWGRGVVSQWTHSVMAARLNAG